MEQPSLLNMYHGKKTKKNYIQSKQKEKLFQNIIYIPPVGRPTNPMQNIWNKIEKSSKAGQDKKSLISTFAYFLTATAKV